MATLDLPEDQAEDDYIDKRISSCRIAILGHEYSKRDEFVRRCLKPSYISNDMDFSVCYIKLNNTRNNIALKVKLWQPYVSLDQIRARSSYFANLGGLILVFDVDNACTFDSIPSMYSHAVSLIEHSPPNNSLSCNTSRIPFYYLIGFNCTDPSTDVVSSREVSYDRARLVADKYGMQYFEITSTLMHDQFDFIEFLVKLSTTS